MSAQYIGVKQASSKPCPKCKGAKHLPNGDGTWRRCDCIRESLYRHACERAGVPSIYVATPLDELKPDRVFVKIVTASIARSMTRLVWAQGKLTGLSMRRSLAWALRSSIDAGLTAATYELPSLIDTWFDRERKADVRESIKTMHTLVLIATNPLSHKVGAQVMEDVYSVRSGAAGLTVFASTDDIGAMPARYGHEVADVFHKRRIAHVVFRDGKVKP